MKHLKLYEYNDENPVNPNYTRVIPRDLFNEAKLLKCVGRLILDIHDNNAPADMKFKHNGKPFKIGLMQDGSLTVMNVNITIKGIECVFKTTYNSKSNYPFYVEHELTDYPVFDDNGKYDQEFLDFCTEL